MRSFYLLAVLIVLVSCDKQICKEPPNNAICGDGIVRYAGMPEADGFGWVISLDNGKTEKPLNLADNYKTDSLKVSVCYEPTTEKFGCFCNQGFIYMVKITSISKR
jgi:hypothetical protein